MYKLCKTAESTRRQREIELVLLECMKRKSYDELSVNEICDEAGVPRKAFYRYFDNKESALTALINHTLESYEFAPKNTVMQRSLEGDLENFFKFWLERGELLNVLAKNKLMGNLMQGALAYSETDKAILEKFLPGESPFMQKSIIRFAICGLMSAMLSWHADGFHESPSDMARVMCRMFSSPLFPNLERTDAYSK